MTDQMDAAMDIIRRLPPHKITTHLEAISELCPDIADELTASVDQPLSQRVCTKTGKDYLLCDYNRDGDSFRYFRTYISQVAVV